MRRRPVTIIQSVVFGLLAINASWEVVTAVFGAEDDPTPLVMMQCVVCIVAAATAWGIWRQAAWAWKAAIAYGVVTAGMLLTLPLLLELPAEARSGIWGGAAGIMLFAVLCAVWLRYDAKRRAASSADR